MNGHPRRAARHHDLVRAAFVFLLALPALRAGASVPVPPGVNRSFEAACARARKSVVTVVGQREHEDLRRGQGRPTRSLASGVVIDGRGHVVTAASVVRDCDRIQVRLPDGRAVNAILLGVDDASDVALLELPVTDVPALRWASEPAAPVGAWVAAVGQGNFSAAQGPNLGTVQRRYEQPLGSLLLLTNEVFPGYSGAPAINSKGELIGLVIGRLSEPPADWSEGDNASFAVAADDLKTVLDHLERYGRVRRGFLGVRMAQGEVVDSSRPGDPFKIGVRVEEVLAGSPAAQAVSSRATSSSAGTARRCRAPRT
jgi:S1-C subfamily serine protease